MNILHLRALLVAIETGSISAAARQLGKTQPQVSQWVSDLEIDLGVEIFTRTGNKTSLTEQGSQLLPHLKHTVSHFDKLQQSAITLAQSEPAVVRIGIEHYIPESLLADGVEQLFAMPQLSLEIWRDDPEQLAEGLIEGELDVIIRHESEQVHQLDNHYLALGSYQEVMVCSHNHPLAMLDGVSSDDLGQYRELVWGIMQQREFEGFGVDYALFSDLAMLLTQLKRGHGYAFVPKANVEHELQRGDLISLACHFQPHGFVRGVEMVWRHGFDASKVGNAALNCLKQHHQFDG
ncbi:LysR family transcriptional regulator [Vibrio sp. LaRot3]|uniref:LysR family transcriptional regulator n=1 Tax=Vibrio sp. LaRot3 TaxID=2998829 RepID=UPI0022CE1EEB|nr:LysR family transcriptional regulator [Vibrio sp. LaRot3]MDA0150602.1 LysR family transcriptional regulator [Vibrio sp. LaRot3]